MTIRDHTFHVAVFLMDGMMSEDIRIGILVRSRMEQVAREAKRAFYAANPGVEGYSGWRLKDGTGVAGYSFCSSLIEMAGGIDRLFSEWEFVVDGQLRRVRG